MEALATLEYEDNPSLTASLAQACNDEDDLVESNNPEIKAERLRLILAGEIVETSLDNLFDLVDTDFELDDNVSISERLEQHSNDLWKRELFFGAVTPFHSETIIAALRKRPDLAPVIKAWFQIFENVSREDFPEIAVGDVDGTAQAIIRDTLKFKAFLASELPSMTMIVEEKIFQVHKNRHREYNSSRIRETVIGDVGFQRNVSRTSPYPLALETLEEGKTFVASVLVQGNKVIAIGADNETGIDQLFDRSNIANIVMTEHFKIEGYTPSDVLSLSETPQEAAEDDFFPSPDFELPNDERSVIHNRDERLYAITEPLFSVIEEAIASIWEDRRSIVTARLMITDVSVIIFAVGNESNFGWSRVQHINANETPRVRKSISAGLREPNFEKEITELETLAKTALEQKRKVACMNHLDFGPEELSDPINARMLEILDEAVKEYQSDENMTERWKTIERDGSRARFFWSATTIHHEKFNEAKSGATSEQSSEQING
jgi:hypothetical protein